LTTRKSLEAALAALEPQRAILGDVVVDAAIAALHQQLADLEEQTPPQPAPEAERRLVTVMFADIAGFTAMAETMDPEAVRDLMNACFDHLVPVVEKYGGVIEHIYSNTRVRAHTTKVEAYLGERIPSKKFRSASRNCFPCFERNNSVP